MGIVLRVVCPCCGRRYFRKVTPYCNLCGVFMSEKSGFPRFYLVAFVIVVLVGMFAAFLVTK